ncbi:MAG TPA: hypothetical protein VHR66_18770 [Gemmataceae bacterium]|jgi:hypothetical protein|nr:hypothetical protein [Gemmataceae bacterium]
MSIGVYCEECEKTYQVRDELAGRKGKCPRNHPIEVPLADMSSEIVQAPAAPAPVSAPAADFAFNSDARFSSSDDDDEYSAPKTKRRRPARVAEDPEPDPAPTAAGDDFSFPTPSLIGGNDEEETPAPKTGRHRKPEPKSSVSKIHKSGKSATGKPSMMPLYLGGILAVLGIGGGATMLILSRGEVGPLRERADSADKRAKELDDKVKQAEAGTAAVKADFDKYKSTPPKDMVPLKELKDTKDKLAAAEKRATEAERRAELQKGKDGEATAAVPAKAPDLDPTAPGGKDDPVMPRGKLGNDPKMEPKKDPKMDPKKDPKMDPKKGPAEKPVAADMPDGIPIGGKNWTVPGSIMLGMNPFKGGDRMWLWPQEDVPLKVVDGKLTIKYKWQLRKGKEMPEIVGVSLMIQEAKQIRTFAVPPKPLAGMSGEGEMTFNVADFKGNLPIYFFIGNGQAAGAVAYSSMISYQVDFGPMPK